MLSGQNRVGNFANLFHLLNKEIQKVADLVQFYGESDGLRKSELREGNKEWIEKVW